MQACFPHAHARNVKVIYSARGGITIFVFRGRGGKYVKSPARISPEKKRARARPSVSSRRKVHNHKSRAHQSRLHVTDTRRDGLDYANSVVNPFREREARAARTYALNFGAASKGKLEGPISIATHTYIRRSLVDFFASAIPLPATS